jgi:pimeloyl-ACP methyl ester carboxylesterase
LRGYGTTRFLSDATFRNGQPSAIATDTIAFIDALKIEKATLAGFDWGARTANIVAAIWPERVKAQVSVSGYLIGNQETGKLPLPPKAELQWWYQFYFATERGRAGYDKYRRDFSKLIWQLASPKWNFDDVTFDRSARAFDNPDHVAIVTIIVGVLALPTAKRDMTISKRSSHKALSSVCRPLPWRATRTARRMRNPPLMPRCLPANIHIGPSRAASDTICRRKRRRPLLKRSSTWRPKDDGLRRLRTG